MDAYSLRDMNYMQKSFHEILSSELRREVVLVVPEEKKFTSESYYNPQENITRGKDEEIVNLNFNMENKKYNLIDPSDTWKKIENNRRWPYSPVGLVISKFGTPENYLEKIGTGTLIGPDVVLTSSNNIYSDMEVSNNKKLGEAFEVKFYACFNAERGIYCKVMSWKFPHEVESAEKNQIKLKEKLKEREKMNFNLDDKRFKKIPNNPKTLKMKDINSSYKGRASEDQAIYMINVINSYYNYRSKSSNNKELNKSISPIKSNRVRNEENYYYNFMNPSKLKTQNNNYSNNNSFFEKSENEKSMFTNNLNNTNFSSRLEKNSNYDFKNKLTNKDNSFLIELSKNKSEQMQCRYNFAVLFLEKTIGNTVGYFGLKDLSDIIIDENSNLYFEIACYPKDKAEIDFTHVKESSNERNNNNGDCIRNSALVNLSFKNKCMSPVLNNKRRTSDLVTPNKNDINYSLINNRECKNKLFLYSNRIDITTDLSCRGDLITYNINTCDGISGAGLFYRKNSEIFLVGLHIKGYGKFENVALLLTKDKINIISEWITQQNKKFISQNEEYLLNLESLVTKYGEEILYPVAKKMKYLTQLNLRNNSLSFESIVLISYNLQNLKKINLSNNCLNDESISIVAKNLCELNDLNLNFNDITDIGCSSICNNLIKVKKLFLCANHLSSDSGINIGKSLTMLDALDLGYNMIGSLGANAVGKSLNNLIYLNLTKNDISDDGVIEIAKNSKCLMYLYLDDNNIGNNGFENICKYLSSLVDLSISRNLITEKGFNNINRINNISSLEIGCNRIQDSGVKLISIYLTKLSYLGLDANQISDAGVSEICKYLAKYEILESLSLNDNDITNKGIIQISNNLFSLNKLNLFKTNVEANDINLLLLNLKKLNHLGVEEGKIVESMKMRYRKILKFEY